MKKKIFSLLLCLSAAILSATGMRVSAGDINAVTVGDSVNLTRIEAASSESGAENARIIYRLLDDGTVEASGYEGDPESVVNVEILPKAGGRIVSRIGVGAFYKCRNLKNITIPGGITEIGLYAFYECTGIENVNFTGSQKMWDNVLIDVYNKYLSDAPRICLNTYDPGAPDNSDEIHIEEGTGIKVSVPRFVRFTDLDGNSLTPVFKSAAVKKSEISSNNPLYNAAVASVYDIWFDVPGYGSVQPKGGEVKVYIPLPHSLSAEKSGVFAVDRYGAMTNIGAVYENGYLVFYTDYLSRYAIAEVMYGDVNFDGNINAQDLSMLRMYLANRNSIDTGPGADINADGEVNAGDLSIIRKYLSDRNETILGPR